MSNPIDLLLNPTSDSGKRSSLKPQWAQAFFDSGVLKPEHLLEHVDDTFVWLDWIERNSFAEDAATLAVHHLNALGFNWMEPIQSDKPERGIDRIFKHCGPATLEQILSTLSEDEVGALHSNVYDPHNHQISILDAAQDNPQAMATLLKWGWNMEGTDLQGQTPLLQAVRWGQARVVLEHGANPLVVDNNATTVLDRARRWARYSRTSAADITKELNTHIRNTVPTGNPQGHKKQMALNAMFAELRDEKTGSLKKNLEVLKKNGATSDELVNQDGRSLVQTAYDQLFKYPLRCFNTSPSRFFARFFVAMMEQHSDGGFIDLNRPFANSAHWSERDVLMMMVLTLQTRRSFKTDFLTPPLSCALEGWTTERFPALVAHLPEIFQPMMDSKDVRDLRSIFTEFLDVGDHSTPSGDFFNTVAHAVATLPFEHPMVQCMVQGLKEQYTLHGQEQMDDIKICGSELRWAMWYCHSNALDDTHILMQMVDAQIMAVWGEWNVGRNREIGGAGVRLDHGDKRFFENYIVQRSSHIERMDFSLLQTWWNQKLSEYDLTSLLEIEGMDQSTVDVLSAVEARMVRHTLEQQLTTASITSSARKM